MDLSLRQMLSFSSAWQVFDDGVIIESSWAIICPAFDVFVSNLLSLPNSCGLHWPRSTLVAYVGT